jgi:heterodisulfide reductase subunit A-like polyferredoxin
MQYENKGRFIVKFGDIPSPRQHLLEIEVDERRNNYKEVELGFDEERALKEAKRCLSCRRCLGCALCWAECKPEAIQFELEDELIELAADSVIVSPGVERALDRIDRRFGLAKDTNVITDLQLERMLNESGPTAGLIIRPYDGEIPASVAFVQAYDKAAPAMHRSALTFAVNEASLLRQKLPKAEVVMFAAGFDDFAEAKKALGTAGAEVLEAPVKSVAANGTSPVKVTFAEDQVKEFDLVVLITQPQMSKDARDLARGLGLDVSYADFLSGDGDGFITTAKQELLLARQD